MNCEEQWSEGDTRAKAEGRTARMCSHAQLYIWRWTRMCRACCWDGAEVHACQVQVPSDQNIPFNEKPAMQSSKITALGIEALKSGIYNQVRLNFPNPDMVGHTGDLDATISACTTVDKRVKVTPRPSVSPCVLVGTGAGFRGFSAICPAGKVEIWKGTGGWGHVTHCPIEGVHAPAPMEFRSQRRSPAVANQLRETVCHSWLCCIVPEVICQGMTVEESCSPCAAS